VQHQTIQYYIEAKDAERDFLTPQTTTTIRHSQQHKIILIIIIIIIL